MIKNILITGEPGCGKTTLIKEILKELKVEARGFFTEEIREGKERIGFKIVTLSKKEGILAEKGIKSPFRVSKYGVKIKELEKIGVKEIEEAIKKDCLIVVDEIGKMELYSEKFKKAITSALESKNIVLATIMLKPNSFCDRIKKRKDGRVFYLRKENFDEIKSKVKNLLQNILKLKRKK